MSVKTHLGGQESELRELDKLSRTLSGRLPAVMLALQQQVLVQRQVVRIIKDLSPQEHKELEAAATNNPIIRKALYKAGIYRVRMGTSRVYVGGGRRRPNRHIELEIQNSVRETANPPGNTYRYTFKIGSGSQDGDVPIPEYLSTKAVSEILDISPQMVRRYCQDRQLKATRTMGLAGDWRIDTKEFIAQDPSRLTKLKAILQNRVERNAKLAETVEKLADRTGVQKILDGIDSKRVEMDRRRELME